MMTIIYGNRDHLSVSAERQMAFSDSKTAADFVLAGPATPLAACPASFTGGLMRVGTAPSAGHRAVCPERPLLPHRSPTLLAPHAMEAGQRAGGNQLMEAAGLAIELGVVLAAMNLTAIGEVLIDELLELFMSGGGFEAHGDPRRGGGG